jgi:hypothetical protein
MTALLPTMEIGELAVPDLEIFKVVLNVPETLSVSPGESIETAFEKVL